MSSWIFYDLGYGMYEIIMVLHMVFKKPYMILGMVSKIQPKSCKLQPDECFSLHHHKW